MKYIALFFFAFFVLPSCDTLFGDECVKSYDLVIPVTYRPSADSLHIGDTLWVTVEADSLLFDSLSMDYVDASKIDFYDLDAITTRFDSSEWYNGVGDFLYYNIRGELGGQVFSSGTSGLIHLVFERDKNGNRIIEAGLIPQRMGCYKMSFTFVPDSYANKKGLIENGCSSETVTFQMKASSDAPDNNIHLSKKSATYGDFPQSEFDRFGYYFFEVHE